MKPEEVLDCCAALQKAAYIIEYYHVQGKIPNYNRLVDDLQNYAEELEAHIEVKH